MKNPNRSVIEQIDSLFQCLSEAQISFALWEGLSEAFSNKETVKSLQPYAAFFIGAKNSFFDSCIISLYAFYERRKDSINIHSLLKAIDQNLSHNDQSDFDKRIGQLKPSWVKICTLRNEVVGHQSLNFHPSDSYKKAGVTPEEIEDLIKQCQLLLCDMSIAFNKRKLLFNVRPKPHLERLLTLVRSNYAIKGTSV